jgi:hypothetical protein
MQQIAAIYVHLLPHSRNERGKTQKVNNHVGADQTHFIMLGHGGFALERLEADGPQNKGGQSV